MTFEAGLPPEAFVERAADALRARHPAAIVDMVDGDALGLEVRWPDGASTRVHLDNAWRAYRGGDQATALRVLASVLPPSTAPVITPGAEALVAVVRGRDLAASVPGDVPSRTLVWSPFVADLAVFMAYDLPQTLEYLTTSELDRLDLSPEEARTRGVSNVLAPLTVERHGEGPVYMLTAGGTYEASLLLDDRLWSRIAEEVAGDVLVAVPCRDLLIFTGSAESDGAVLIAAHAARMARRGAYPLSKAVLRWTDEGWLEEEPGYGVD